MISGAYGVIGSALNRSFNSNYRFSPCRSIKVNEQRIGIWNSQDTLVIKALTQLLSQTPLPKLSSHCKLCKAEKKTFIGKANKGSVRNTCNLLSHLCHQNLMDADFEPKCGGCSSIFTHTFPNRRICPFVLAQWFGHRDRRTYDTLGAGGIHIIRWHLKKGI